MHNIVKDISGVLPKGSQEIAIDANSLRCLIRIARRTGHCPVNTFIEWIGLFWPVFGRGVKYHGLPDSGALGCWRSSTMTAPPTF